MSPGLPGMVTVDVAAQRAWTRVSRWTMLISSPTNFFANDGTPAAACTWSMVTWRAVAASTGSIVTVLRSTRW